MKPTTLTKEKALAALDNMETIVLAEMLVRGEYLELQVSHPERSGAICGGRRACAIGSLYIGAGVRISRYKVGSFSYAQLPGVNESERKSFMRHRPHLRLAYDALNESAEAYAQRHSLVASKEETSFDSPLEGLFECNSKVWVNELTEVIRDARQDIQAMETR